MSKEFSTFADGSDCKECAALERKISTLTARLAAAEADNARLRESLKVERGAVKRLNERLANCSKSSKSSTHTCCSTTPACNMDISPAREK